MRGCLSVVRGCALLVLTALVACALGFVLLVTHPELATSGPIATLLEATGLSQGGSLGAAGEPDVPVVSERPEVPESEHGLWYAQLSAEQQEAYDCFLAPLAAREPTFVIEGATEAEAGPAYRAIIGDHPELFWLNGAYTYRQPREGGRIEVTPTLTVPAGEVADLQGSVEAVVAGVIAELPSGASDYDRARHCYEWIIENASYDEAEHDQNVQGVFLDGVAVCAGYARAFQYLMHEMGIRCEYLSGGDHAWNLVWLDGTPTYVDVTWGDPVFMAENGERAPESMIYDYLCLTTDELYRNHTVAGPVSDPALLPACDSTAYDYYRLNGLFFEEFSADGLAHLINEAAYRGERSVRVKYASDEAYQEALAYLYQDVFWVDGLAGVDSIYHGGDERLHILSVEW